MEWIQGTWLDLYAAEFLIRYVPLGAAAFVVSWALWRFLPRRWARPSYPTLDGYETAMLAGGLDRVCRTAVSSLHERGIVTFVGGMIQRVDDEETPELSEAEYHPVESDVLSAAHVGAQAAELKGVLKRRGEELKSSLTSKGYWLEGPELLQVRLAAALPVVAWLTLGVLKMMVGIDRGRPVGVVAVLLILGVIGLFVMLAASVRSEGAWGYLSRQQKHYEQQASAASTSTDAAVGLMAIAVLGVASDDSVNRFFGEGAGVGYVGDGGDGGDGGGGGCSGCGGCGGCGG